MVHSTARRKQAPGARANGLGRGGNRATCTVRRRCFVLLAARSQARALFPVGQFVPPRPARRKVLLAPIR
jgi:hypothetical protein